MLLETFHTVRDLPRLRDISAVLIRHGMGDLVHRLGVIRMLERAGQILHLQQPDHREWLDPAIRARMAMEELGPTFVKLGQVLATRADMFPPHWITEFEKLQSQVPPVAPELLLQELTSILGADPHTVFARFDPVPIGSASIAQVHRASLHDGTEVILKIRRPGIVGKVEADLRILQHLAGLIEKEFPDTQRYRPTLVVEQFSKSMRREMDLAMEARNLERFARNFHGHAFVVVPKVYWPWTSDRMNVQEWIDGIPGHDLAAAEAQGLDRRLLAKHGADAVLKMVLVDGYFHADPHPGNVFYLPNNRLAFVDFGMVGRLPHQRRDQIVDLLAALARRDERGILDVLLEWTDQPESIHEEKLAADIAEFQFNYEHLSLKEINFGTLLSDVVSIMREHSITLPADMTLLFKTLITLEGLGRQLDPKFQMVTHLTPFVRQIITARYQPKALLQRGQHGLMSGLGLLTGLPRDLGQLLKLVRRGKMTIDLDLKRLDHFGQQLNRSTNRLTLGIVTGALIIGSSIVMTVPFGPKLFGVSFMGFLGFTIAFLNSIWLIFSIMRSSKD